MKQIIIKKLSIVNFKGIRKLDIDFDGLETIIRGANGTGKTTIFDAFTWLLFGKDSKGRTKFNLKTLDASGEPIPQLPHEVSAVLDIDGEKVSIRRCWTEIWSTYRGGKEPVFDHNEGERYYNEVPCSEKEFKEKIDAICNEDRFRELTNPLYFTSQSKEYQRNALLAMVGDLSVEDIVASDPETLGAILDKLSGKTIAEFEREVACHKKRVKAAIADLEPRIDEKKRDISSLSVENWEALETAINERKREIESIDEQIADVSKAYEAISADRTRIAIEISRLQDEYDRRQLSLKDELLADYRKALAEYQDECYNIDIFNANASTTRRQLEGIIEDLKQSLRQAEEDKERLEAKRMRLLDEYRSLMASEFNEESAVCPTCRRPLEEVDRYKLYKEFVEQKEYAIERNKENGIGIKQKIEDINERISNYYRNIEHYQANVAIIEFKDKSALVAPKEPNIDVKLADDVFSLRIEERIAALREQLSKEVKPADTSKLIEKKRVINDEISEIAARLATRSEIARATERVSELEKALIANRKELEEDNRMGLLIFNFNKARINMIESRINSMFKYVTFRMYNRLNNGELAETCECMIDGVPFSDLNNAASINAGLDIINAICRVYGMCAPIFIDNRESVTSIISTEAQVISLIVDAECKTLDIDKI